MKDRWPSHISWQGPKSFTALDGVLFLLVQYSLGELRLRKNVELRDILPNKFIGIADSYKRNATSSFLLISSDLRSIENLARRAQRQENVRQLTSRSRRDMQNQVITQSKE